MIGSEVVAHFCGLGWRVYGVDNNMRADFFGPSGDTRWNQRRAGTMPGRLRRSYNCGRRPWRASWPRARRCDATLVVADRAAPQRCQHHELSEPLHRPPARSNGIWSCMPTTWPSQAGWLRRWTRPMRPTNAGHQDQCLHACPPRGCTWNIGDIGSRMVIRVPRDRGGPLLTYLDNPVVDQLRSAEIDRGAPPQLCGGRGSAPVSGYQDRQFWTLGAAAGGIALGRLGGLLAPSGRPPSPEGPVAGPAGSTGSPAPT